MKEAAGDHLLFEDLMTTARDDFESLATGLQERIDDAVSNFLADLVRSLDLVRKDNAAHEVQEHPQLKIELESFLSDAHQTMIGLEHVLREQS